MAWIRQIEEDEAEGTLKRLFDKLRGDKLRGDKREPVDHILKIHSLNPGSLRGHLGLYREVMFGPSPLSRAQREMIAVTVSAVNHCHY